MTSPAEPSLPLTTLLERLEALDVRLTLDGDNLRVSAPTGVLTAELRDELRARRGELRAALGAPAERRMTHGARDGAPLSFEQERLWFFHQLEPESTAYNMTIVLTLTGPLDVPALQRALDAVVQRQSSLRARFFDIDGEPRQRVVEFTPTPFATDDLSDLPPEARDAAASLAWKREAERPFDLAAAAPFRVRLIRLARDEHHFVITLHHIVADGASLLVFVRELAASYARLTGLPAAELPALERQYVEYASSQRAWASSPDSARAMAFWKERLGDDLPVLDLPSDRPRPAIQTFRGDVAQLVLSRTTSDGLRALSQRHGCTLFMTLLAVFDALLLRHAGDEDVVVGVPMANRDRAETANLVGMFVNTLVLRADLAGDPTFAELLGRVRQGTLQAFAHQDVPFARLLDELRPHRDLSRSPLFQVMFNMFPYATEESLRIGDLTIRTPSADRMLATYDAQSKFDLTLYAYDRLDGLSLLLSYNADLFDAPRMKRMLADVGVIAEAVVRDASIRLGDLPLAGAAAAGLPRAQHVMRSGAFTELTSEFVDGSVVQRFADAVERFAERPAVVTATHRWSYAELAAHAARLSTVVAAATRGTPARVALLCEHDAPMIAAMLGVLGAGAAYVPLDPTAPDDRLALLLADVDAVAVLVDPAYAELAHRVAGGRPVIRTDASVETRAAPVAPPSGDSLAYVLYTSGSTGRPKGVAQNQRAVLHYVRAYTNALELTADDRLTLVASYTFDAAVVDVFSALLNGAALHPVALRTGGVHAIARTIEQQGITVYHSTPTLFRALTPLLTMETVASVRAVVLGGERVQSNDFEAFRAHFAPGALFVNLYGASEATIATMALYPRDGVESSAAVQAIGYPVEDTEVAFRDSVGHTSRARGELVVRSPYVALGYWGAIELTQEVFSAPLAGARVRSYRTGDVARRLPSGAIEHLGRRDEQIKIRGVRIEPGEIESCLRAHAAVAQCAVVAERSNEHDPALVAFVVLAPGATATPEELGKFLARSLPEYMLPAAIALLDALPLTRTGKVDRRALPSARALVQSSRREFIAPRDAIEQLVADVWADVLGVAEISVHGNFFELGGHSLHATQVLARLREMTHVELPLRALFGAPTLERFAASVRELTAAHTDPEPELRARVHEGPIPLSYSQERMWFLQQLSPEGTAYNMVTGASLTGAFDRQALAIALHDVALRQAALRTTFTSPGGEPRQHVAQIAAPRLLEHDLRAHPADERLAIARRMASEMGARPFDLERGPLWWVMLFRVDDERHVVVVGCHHIIGDLWSFGVLGHDLTMAYVARSAGEAPRFPTIDVGYADYAVWQREWLEGRQREQIAYWVRQLSGITPLELTPDRPRPPVLTSSGERRLITLSPAAAQAIRAFSLRENVTPFMTLFAAFNVLMYRYTGQDDIVIGVPIANRTRVGTERLIGTFVNTLVHRNDLSGDPSFRAFVKRVRGVALDGFAHQDLPFERLVRELAPERDPSRSPVFQVLFNVANAPVRVAESWGGSSEPFLIDRFSAQFELAVNVVLGDESNISVTYNTDLFDAQTIDRLLTNYVTLLEAAVQRPEQRVATLPIMPASERRALIEYSDATVAEFPSACVTALVVAQAQRTPDAVAVESAHETLSYAELDGRSTQLARYLHRRGVRPGGLVGVCLDRSANMVVALLGVLKAGAAYVPIDPAYPSSRIQFMLEDADIGAIVGESAVADRLAQTTAALVLLDRDAADIAREAREALAEGPAPGDRAYVIFTSGSTGRPKGVQIPHSALVNFLWSMRQLPGMTSADRLLAVTTISFDIAGLELYLPLICGATVIIADRAVAADGRRLREALVRQAPTVMQATPATWKSLIDAGWHVGETPNLRILCGGEALPRDLANELLDRGRELWNLYGPTETTIWSTAHRVVRGSGTVPIGLPIANTQVYVLDGALQIVPVGVPGELYIGGLGMAIGYLNRPDLTSARFVDDPFGPPGGRMYRTGDRARIRLDGTVEHLGRLDNQVKLRGYRIELGEIEAALATLPALARCVVDVRQERLIAYVVFARGHEMTASEIRSALRDTLPDFMVPSLVVPLDALPLTPNGKVDRRALPDPLRNAARGQAAHAPPRTPTEVLIAAIWRDALGVERVGATDNFFELGGHSLLAMRVVHEIHRQTGWRPDPRLLFFETLASIAAARSESPAAGTPA